MSACSTAPDISSPLPLGLLTSAPAGYADLCAREPAQCPEEKTHAGLIEAAYAVPQAGQGLSPDRWKLLNDVNSTVNHKVRYESDQDNYGKPDYWEPAVNAGDCEDYALAKRQMLWAAGWNPDELSLALVQSRETGPHAVLIASTAQGAYVLDSANGWILPWKETDYSWVTAQDADGQWRVAGPNAQAVLLAVETADRLKIIPAGPPAQKTASLDSGRKIPDVGALEPGGR